MKLRIIIVSLIAGVLCTAPTVAQVLSKNAKPNFSGNWTLERSEDVQDKIFKPKLTQIDPLIRTVTRLTIEHTDPELKMTEVVTAEQLDASGNVVKKTDSSSVASVYYTDKRGERNRDNSTSKWDGKSIIVSITREKGVSMVLKLSLSKDEKELTIVTLAYQLKYNSVSRSDYMIGLPIGGTKVYVKN